MVRFIKRLNVLCLWKAWHSRKRIRRADVRNCFFVPFSERSLWGFRPNLWTSQTSIAALDDLRVSVLFLLDLKGQKRSVLIAQWMKISPLIWLHVNFTAHHRRYFPNIRADVGDRQHSRRKNDDRSSFKSKLKWFFWHSQSSVITRMKRELGLFTRVVRFSQLRSFSVSADSIAWNECEDGDKWSTQGGSWKFCQKISKQSFQMYLNFRDSNPSQY